VAATGCPVHADFDPLSAEFLADPFAALTDVPVFYAPSIEYYVLTFHPSISFREPLELWVQRPSVRRN